METVAMLQKQIAGYVLQPTDDEVLECALAGIRRGIDRLNMVNWSWAITYDDIYFDATLGDYPLQKWFKAPLNFELFDSSNQRAGRFEYKPWKTFLLEHAMATSMSSPPVYSAPNVFSQGTISLEAAPSADFVLKYPNGRIWYYKYIQYPTGPGSVIDAPSPATSYLYEWACAHTANNYAQSKVGAAYQRANQLFEPGGHTGALLTADNDVHTDWQGE